MSWKDKLPGCFGDGDKRFARHPLKRANCNAVENHSVAELVKNSALQLYLQLD